MLRRSLICITSALIFSLLSAFAFAICDLSHFRWPCDIPVRMKPHASTHLVYCGNTPVYVTAEQYYQLVRYQRANVQHVLKINEDYLESPCIPSESYGYRRYQMREPAW
ncbi:MAG: hypothetical protein H2069_00050 [Legionella sp.]|nr:hypothetical protein [Legionella sp.]